MRNRILGLTHVNATQALYYPTVDYCTEFTKRGYRAEVLDLLKSENFTLLQQYLKEGEVFFCFALQGVGSRLETMGGENLWSVSQTPFIGLHFDHPCHNFYNHFNASPFVANIYHFKSFYDVQKRYSKTPQVTGLLPFEFFSGALERIYSFKERPIKLLYLKTGGALEEYTEIINRLPAVLRDSVWQQIKRTEKDPNLILTDLIDEAFQAAKLEREALLKEFWGVIECVDNYIRRKRAILFVEWLKTKEGALIIGDGWDFIDKSNARATFKPSMSNAQAYPFYAQAQFSCNTNPYGPDIVHERTPSGLIHGGCSLSDSNAWWVENFGDIDALSLYDWSMPLADQLDPIIGDIEKAATAADSGNGEKRVRELMQNRHGIERIIGYAEEVRNFAASSTPSSMNSR